MRQHGKKKKNESRNFLKMIFVRQNLYFAIESSIALIIFSDVFLCHGYPQRDSELSWDQLFLHIFQLFSPG